MSTSGNNSTVREEVVRRIAGYTAALSAKVCDSTIKHDTLHTQIQTIKHVMDNIYQDK